MLLTYLTYYGHVRPFDRLFRVDPPPNWQNRYRRSWWTELSRGNSKPLISRLVKLYLQQLRSSSRCDSGLGMLLLHLPSISLLPRPEQETFFWPKTAVCAVDLQYDIGQTTSLFNLCTGKSQDFETGFGHFCTRVRSDNARQYAWLDVRNPSYLTTIWR